MDKLYSMKNAEENLGYGKHSNYSIVELICYEPDYIEWMEKQDNIFFSDTLKMFIDVVRMSRYMLPDDEDMMDLIKEYTDMEDECYSDYVQAKKKREDDKARNKAAHLASMQKISFMTDEDIHNYVWKYYSSGLMEKDTIEGNIIWKMMMNDNSEKSRRSVYKTKMNFGLLLFVKESSFNSSDEKWHSKYRFIADETIIVNIIKAENASPVSLTKAIEKNLR